MNTTELEQIARTVFESTETMMNSLWLQRTHRTEAARTDYLTEFARMRTEDHLGSDVFWAEVNALALWIGGESLSTIADAMPTFGRTGLFASSEQSSMVSDVAEYTSRIGYPGSWTWTAAHTLAREMHGLTCPTWISASVEYGAPTETAVSLMRRGGLSRPGTLQIADTLGPVWSVAADALRQDDSLDPWLTAFDQSRLRNVRAQLQRDVDEEPHA